MSERPKPWSHANNQDRRHYLRSSTGMLHLRAYEPASDDWLSTDYSRCGLHFDLGREAIPLMVGEEPRVCRKCRTIEP